MLERHPLVTDQVAYEFQWDRVDALYQFVNRLPAWVVDDKIVDVWASGCEDDPQSFCGWEAKRAEWGQALMLSWAPAQIGGGTASPMVKVYTTVVVCIHPCQAVMSIRDAARDLLGHAVATPTRSMSALCQLPKRSANTFYPSLLNHSFLVLPYLGAHGAKKVRLDTSIALNKHIVVRRLHRCRTKGGDEAVLPPIYSKDPSLPGTLEVGYMGPMWENTQYTAAVPTGGTGLLGVRPAISEVTFCTDEIEAGRSLAPMKGEGVVYSPQWYDASGKSLDCLTTSPPTNPFEEPPSGPEDKHDEEVTSVPPAAVNTVGDGPDDDTKSKKASSSESESDSDSSGSGLGSGSGDSSSDSASSHSKSGEGDANSDAQSDVTKCKVRRKKKPHQSNEDSDEEAASKVMAAKTGGHSDDDVKRTLQDSGVGEGTTANPPGLFGLDATALGCRYAAGIGGAGSLPLPTTLPSMATLEALTDDLEKLSKKMFKSLEETNIKVYDKVLQGFKDTSGKCKDFIHDMWAMVITFFGQAEKMEQGLAKTDAEAFREAINASKGHVCGLIEEVAEAEGIYNSGEARFNSILASVAKEVKAFVRQEGDKQRKEYKEQCLAWIRQDHGRLDGTCFIPMIIGNLTAHRALAISQRVTHSHVPLKIMSAPLHTQAGAVKVYMRFVEFLAGRVIVLQERLGPNTTTVPLESETGGQSISPTCRRSSSFLPA